MSNRLLSLLSQTGPAASQAATSTAPDIHIYSKPFLTLLSLSLCALVFWVVRRIAHPKKLTLSTSPGRPNDISVVHIALLMLLYMGCQFIWVRATGLSSEPVPDTAPQVNQYKLRLVGIALSQIIWLSASLLVAARTFRFGLRRGMGLDMRHWIFDTARGLLGFMAVFSVCYALLAVGEYLLKTFTHISPRQHELLQMLSQLPSGWLVLAIFMATVLAPIVEEVFCRGLVQSMLRAHTGSPWGAILISGAFFALLHVNSEPQATLALFALAVVLGYNYERCGRLYPAILIHAVFNGVNIILWLGNWI